MKSFALITGASSGIGLELAKLCAQDGFNLLLISRNGKNLTNLAKELENLYAVEVICQLLDLTKSDAAYQIFNLVDNRKLNIDILINNAGFGYSKLFLESNIKEQEQMMQLNIMTLTLITRLIGAEMLKKRQGKIVNVASVAAYFPGPFMAVYYASKAFVLSFSEALAEELKGTGVSVTALCPGSTITNFQKRAGLGEAKLFNSNLMDASTVAQIGYDGMMQGKRVVIPGIINLLEVLFSHFFLRPLAAKFIKNLHT